jgi:hypothetical protein
VIVLGERHPCSVLGEFALEYFNTSRPHQGLGQRIPVPAARQLCSEPNKIVAVPVLGGLHHDYRMAAWSAADDNGSHYSRASHRPLAGDFHGAPADQSIRAAPLGDDQFHSFGGAPAHHTVRLGDARPPVGQVHGLTPWPATEVEQNTPSFFLP